MEILSYKFFFLAALVITLPVIGILSAVLHSEIREIKTIRKHNCELSNTTERLKLVIKAAKMSTWDINVTDRTIDFNFENFDAIENTDSYSTTISKYYKALHPDDVAKIQDGYIDILNGTSTIFHEEYRVIFPGTSEYRWMESYAIVSKRDLSGMPTMLVGASILIEDRKNSKEA